MDEDKSDVNMSRLDGQWIRLLSRIHERRGDREGDRKETDCGRESDSKASSPLLPRLGGAAFEGTSGPLLELGRGLLLSRVCHFILKQLVTIKNQILAFRQHVS